MSSWNTIERCKRIQATTLTMFPCEFLSLIFVTYSQQFITTSISFYTYWHLLRNNLFFSTSFFKLSRLTRQELYDLHKLDPEEWTCARLSREFGLKLKRVEGIISLFDLREGMHPSYVRHELEDSIIEMEVLCNTSTMTKSENGSSNHPEMVWKLLAYFFGRY